ncbi:transporter substrate-binding domain-containing protein [Hahella sp. KA22]|uniref:substrate-binding periplasmic protein n=1 Tax=Hahella sp. KA22 TaxID=1628392 RepID=UPI000FDCF568|nr:transporter substrate-binding domain-containing protein [Hahella sp. KA22]AZZ95272.1 transporter substrate-binding domain-containing protein [Hahella sp. KA22]QAY52917.1 transporter substrate-binding domain-containing protein [Hahella sp. KA22]
MGAPPRFHRYSRTPRSLAGLALALLLSATSASAASVGVCDTLNVTGNPEYPPFLWRDRDNPDQLIGVAVRLLEIALEPENITVESRYVGPWSRAQVEAQLGRVDMLTGAFITEERQTYMDYIKPPMMIMPNVIFVKKGKAFPMNSWLDLKDRHGDTLINNSFGQEFDEFAERQLSIEEVRSIEFAFERLLLGRTDYVIYELYQGYAIGEVRGFKGEIEHLPTPISSEGLYYTVSKKSPCHNQELIDFLNKRLRELVDKKAPESLVERYMTLWRKQATAIDISEISSLSTKKSRFSK